MKNKKELWMQYQMEKELQLVPVEITDWNEERIRELQKQLAGQFALTEIPIFLRTVESELKA